MKLFTKRNLSSWPKYLFNRTRAFSSFDADLKIMSICKLKFSLLSIWTPNILTFETTLMFSLSIVIFSFRYKSEFLLSNKITWNLSGLTIYGTATFEFQNAYKIIYGPCKTWQGIIIGEILNRHISQEKEKIVEENIK